MRDVLGRCRRSLLSGPMLGQLDVRRGLAYVSTVAVVAVAAGCGGGDSGDSDDANGANTFEQQPEAAANPTADDFPPADGQTLKQLADANARTGATYAAGTQTYSPGENRVAFGLLGEQGQAFYAPTAIYVARTPNSPAKGPFLAPTDSLVTDAPYRSQTAATEGDSFASVYAANVPLPKAGKYAALALSSSEGQFLGAVSQYKVRADGPVPEVGDPAPVADTDALSEVGDISKIDTREPPDSMHNTELADVVGEKPVALLFATPALCQSRVCGPVTDIAEQLKTEYGDQVEFIHQEVYVDNDPNKGLRPSLLDYGLRSEPWLFTVDADGKIAARLEGSFGVDGFEDAVQKAIG